MARKQKFTAGRLARLRTELAALKDELLASLDAESVRDIDLLAGDEGDRATESVSQDLDLDTRERHARDIQRIEEAMEKIDEGTYGVCKECGGPIAQARLEALPFARHCVTCQERLDLEEISVVGRDQLFQRERA